MLFRFDSNEIIRRHTITIVWPILYLKAVRLEERQS